MSKRILIVSPTPTHPPTSGNRSRINTIVSCLKEMGHDVHLLHIEREPGDIDTMKKFWGNSFHSTKYHQPPRNFFRKLLNKIKSIYDSESRYRYSLDEWWDKSANEVLTRLHQQYQFEVVMVEYIFFSKALDHFPSNVLKIIDTHDVFTDRHKIYLERNLQPDWYSTSKKEEQKALNRANLIFAIQDEERDFFSEITHNPVITIGHIVPITPPFESNKSHRILYMASKNKINIDAIEWFIKNVFPIVRNTVPQAELHVAGNICESIANCEGIIKLGVVSELKTQYDQADVVINPMLYGTGLKIKNIEALGYAKALVTCPVGTTGIEDGAGHAFLVADGANQFAECVINVLTDDALKTNLSQRAHEYASNWNKLILKRLNEALTTLPSH